MQPTKSNSCDASKTIQCVKSGCVEGKLIPHDLPIHNGHFVRQCTRCQRVMVEVIFDPPFIYDVDMVKDL
jgi:hypothetical protein